MDNADHIRLLYCFLGSICKFRREFKSVMSSKRIIIVKVSFTIFAKKAQKNFRIMDYNRNLLLDFLLINNARCVNKYNLRIVHQVHRLLGFSCGMDAF